MSDHVETTGKTVDEAISEALLQLGARRDEVDVTVLEEGRSGFLGFLGARAARVLVRRKGPARQRRESAGAARGRPSSRSPRTGGQQNVSQERPRRGRPPARDRTPDERAGADRAPAPRTSPERPGKGRDSQEQPTQNRQRQERPRRGRGRQERTREERPAQDRQRQERPRQDRPRPDRTSSARPDSLGASERGWDTRGLPGGEPVPPAETERAAEPAMEQAAGGGMQAGSPGASVVNSSSGPQADVPSGSLSDSRPSPRREGQDDLEPGGGPASGHTIRGIDRVAPLRDVPKEEVVATLEQIAKELMRRSSFPCRCEVKEGEYHLVKITTDDTSAGVLIGRHGSTIDAFEHLVERMASQAVGERVNMNLDINNYRRRREEALIERTRSIVARVKSTGREVHTEPLCARERRIIHLEVLKSEGVRTYTIATANGKHVVVARGDPDEQSQEPDVTGDEDGFDRDDASRGGQDESDSRDDDRTIDE